MTKVDFSIESEDEFYEDFSGWEITDDELKELLIQSRRTSDIKLRRLVKQSQYFRWLMPKILELAEQTDHENTFVTLERLALRSTTKDKQS